MNSLVPIALWLVILGACGGATPPNAAGTSVTCTSTPTPITDPSLPPGFPEPGTVTWTSTRTAGPSQVVTGYSTNSLGDLFIEFKARLGEGVYSVTKSEREARDAEVNFGSADHTGQVRLGEECAGRTSVAITIRPAA